MELKPSAINLGLLSKPAAVVKETTHSGTNIKSSSKKSNVPVGTQRLGATGSENQLRAGKTRIQILTQL